MGFKDQSIKRKTMAVIMLTSVAVLLLTAAAFTVYDLATYRQNLVAQPLGDGGDHRGPQHCGAGLAGRKGRPGNPGLAARRPAHCGGGAL